jgi:hypothetical protein
VAQRSNLTLRVRTDDPSVLKLCGRIPELRPLEAI